MLKGTAHRACALRGLRGTLQGALQSPRVWEQQVDLCPHSLPRRAQGVPQAPMCGFSNMACAILNLYGEPAPPRMAPFTARRLSLRCRSCAAPNPNPLPTAGLSAGVEYGSRNVLADPEVREGIKRFTAWPTIPQVRQGAAWLRVAAAQGAEHSPATPRRCSSRGSSSAAATSFTRCARRRRSCVAAPCQPTAGIPHPAQCSCKGPPRTGCDDPPPQRCVPQMHQKGDLKQALEGVKKAED